MFISVIEISIIKQIVSKMHSKKEIVSDNILIQNQCSRTFFYKLVMGKLTENLQKQLSIYVSLLKIFRGLKNN